MGGFLGLILITKLTPVLPAVVIILLAIAWRRLSWALVPKPVVAVATAVLFMALVSRCHMAGEWIVADDGLSRTGPI